MMGPLLRCLDDIVCDYIMGDFQPCPPYVWNHKKYQIQPCPGIQSWWDSNDWWTKIICIFIIIVKPRDLIMISKVTFPKYDVTKGNVIK